MNKETNYWVVGASWEGYDHQDERFVNEGIWMLGWDKDDQPAQYQKATKIEIGDRIAIKRMKGRGQSGIRIMHIGVIRGVILDADKVICSVNWVATHLNRDIAESKGCFASIHGPYYKSNPDQKSWIEGIFSL
ncbi:MAG: hypothetical protein ACFB21_10445 [Opitutales bacterium]